MRFSLITVTTGRGAELARLRDSLAAQTCSDFEHLVIDHREHPELKNSLSAARNLALEQATGDILAFPDDDAWYAPNVLEEVSRMLADSTADGVSFRVTDGAGSCSAGGWMSSGEFAITKANVWRSAVSCSFFVRRDAARGIRFDERLGVGSVSGYGAGEDTDYLLQLLARGVRMRYVPSQLVFHPLTADFSARRGWRYGVGVGGVLRKHGYGVVRLFWMMSLKLVRALAALMRLRFRAVGFHAAMGIGRLAGYMRWRRSPDVGRVQRWIGAMRKVDALQPAPPAATLIARRLDNLRLATEYRKLVGAFNAAGIVPLVIKGGVMKTLRPELPRQMGDYDVLVSSRSEFERCREIGRSRGLEEEIWEDRVGVDFHRPGSTAGILDLHVRLRISRDKYHAMPALPELFERARPCKVNGVDSLLPCPEDAVFVILGNLAKNIFTKCSLHTLTNAVEDLRWFLKRERDFDWSVVWADARHAGNLGFVFAALAVLDLHLPGLALRAMPPPALARAAYADCVRDLFAYRFTEEFRVRYVDVRESRGLAGLPARALLTAGFFACRLLEILPVAALRERLLGEK